MRQWSRRDFPWRCVRCGVTLVELMVVLAVLGLMAGVVGVAFRRTEPPPGPSTLAAAHVQLAAARRDAITTGSSVTITVTLMRPLDADPSDTSGLMPDVGPVKAASRQYRVTAFPDGSILGDPALAIERLTGRPLQSRGRR